MKKQRPEFWGLSADLIKPKLTSEELEEFDRLVEYGKWELADMVPYDSSNYYEDLQCMAEGYARDEMFGSDLDELSKLHDEMLERGEIDDSLIPHFIYE